MSSNPNDEPTPSTSRSALNSEACLLCSINRQPQVGRIFEKPELVQLVRNVLGIFLERDESLPETICCNCIMRINCCLEFQRCVVRNMFNHRIRYYYNIGDRANAQRYQTECKTFQTKCMTLPSGVSEALLNDSSVLARFLRDPSAERATTTAAFLPARTANNDTAGLVLSKVRTDELPQEPESSGDENDAFDVQPSASSTNGTPSTGPKSKNQKADHASETASNATSTTSHAKRRKQTESMSYQCPHCPKVYRQASAWRKHLRKHQTSDQRSRPVALIQRPKHKCPDCNQEFESMTVLRKHSIVHEKPFICKTCGEVFRIKHDFTWHAVCCEAKNTAMNSTDEPRRRTRSQGRPIEINATKKPHHRMDDSRSTQNANFNDNASMSSHYSVDSTRADSMYNERIEVVKLWTEQLDIGDKPDPKDLTSNSVRDDDCMSVMSDVSTMSRISDVSTSRATPSREPSTSQAANWAHEQKRRKLHKAGKRRAKQRGKEYFACSSGPLCSFGSTSLAKTMYHEVKEHNALLLHNCAECNEWFTNKENLIRHKKRHRPQLHICINCNYKFDNKYELEHHTLLHAEKSFPCAYCEMSFLKRAELARHINTMHQNDAVQKYGIIDRIAAAGKTQPSPYLRRPNNFEGYQSKEMIQRAPASEASSTLSQNNNNHSNHTSHRRSAVTKRHRKLWSSVYSVSSSCYSLAKSKYDEYDDEFDDDDDDDEDSYNGNRIVTRTPLPPGPLECFDVFSIDTLGMDEELSCTPKRFTSTDLMTPIRNGGGGGDIDDGDHLDLPRREKNRTLIALNIDLFDKYIPPYDVLFEKYLTSKKHDERNERNETNEMTPMQTALT